MLLSTLRGRERENWREWYAKNPEAVQLVADHFAEDVLRLGYTGEEP